jgi:hypothetical protein
MTFFQSCSSDGFSDEQQSEVNNEPGPSQEGGKEEEAQQGNESRTDLNTYLQSVYYDAHH